MLPGRYYSETPTSSAACWHETQGAELAAEYGFDDIEAGEAGIEEECGEPA
jgi:hypothetical protein